METKCLKCGRIVQHDDSRVFRFCPFCGSKAENLSSGSQSHDDAQPDIYSTGQHNPNTGERHNAFGEAFDIILGDRFPTGKAPKPQNGKDIRFRLEVSPHEAVFGTTRIISFDKEDYCNACNGSGSYEGTGAVTCPTCNGKGIVEQPTQTLFGKTLVRRACPTCNSRGAIINKPCIKCRGKGRLKMKKNLPVAIPPDVRTGTVLSVKGEGELGKNGGNNGNLLIEVVVIMV